MRRYRLCVKGGKPEKVDSTLVRSRGVYNVFEHCEAVPRKRVTPDTTLGGITVSEVRASFWYSEY